MPTAVGITLAPLTEEGTKTVFAVLVQLFICFIFSWWTFFRTQLIRLKEGKVYGNILFQYCCVASVTMLYIVEVHAKAWTQKGPLLGIQNVSLCPETEFGEVFSLRDR